MLMSTKNDKELDYYTIHSAIAVPVITSAAAGSLTVRGGSGRLMGLNVVAGASAGFVMLFDAASVPVDGAVVPLKVFPLAANGSMFTQFDPPIAHTLGMQIVFSTTGPFSKTISSTAYISAESQSTVP